MKRIVQLLAVAIALTSFGFAQNPVYPFNIAGRVIVSEYSKWSVHSTNTTAAGAQTMTLDNCFVSVGTSNRKIFPIAVNVPVTIIDGTLTETALVPTSVVQPTSSVGPSVNPYSCSFTTTFTNAHNAGVTIVSGDSGLEEAINDAIGQSVGVVTIDPLANVTATQMAAALVYPTVQIEDVRGGKLLYWNPQPSTQTVLATPAVRVAATTCPATLLVTTVCSPALTGGTWPNSAEFVCVTYIDIMGGESPCSTTTSYTPTGATSTMYFSAPAASTGAVGWRAYAGLAYLTTAYQLPLTSTTCTLTTLETTIPACAVTNALYGQVGSAATFLGPTVTTSMVPQSGGVAASSNPNPISHQSFTYAPALHPYAGFEQSYGAFPTTVALTAGQMGVLGSVILPTGYLNYIGETIVVRGKVLVTPTTGGTLPIIEILMGDITDFTTGTPQKIVCKEEMTQTQTTASNMINFECRLSTLTTGTTGTVMPAGHAETILTAGTTLGSVAAEETAAAVTVDVLDQDTLFIEFLQTSGAETAGPTLLALNIDVL